MNLQLFLKSSRLGDVLLRRPPFLYARFRRLLRIMDAASKEKRQTMRDRLTQRALKWGSDTAYARAHGLAGQDFNHWPLLEKEVLREKGKAWERRVLSLTTGAETGGSTGVPIALRRSWGAIVFEQATLDHLAARFGSFEWATSRTAILRGNTIKDPSDHAPPFWVFDHGAKNISLSSHHLHPASWKLYEQALQQFQPSLLWVYPSSLAGLLRAAEGEAVSIPSLKLILASSERMDAELYKKISDKFHIPVVDYYGQAERVCFSYRATLEEHFFLPLYGRVELLPAHEEGEWAYYEIIGTSYWNKAQPLMRFRTGDLARLPRGLSAAEIEEVTLGLRPFAGIEGRVAEYLLSPEGVHLIGLNIMVRGIPDVAQVQIIQKTLADVEICVLPLSTYNAATEAIIMEKARQKIPQNMAITIRAVEKLTQTARGKTPLVIREI